MGGEYRRAMVRRLILMLVAVLVAMTQPAHALPGDAPTVGTPTITPVNAATVSVSVPIDTQDAETVVKVEYVTAGAYRGQRVPGAATTVTIATVPASATGPSTVSGQVTGLEPGTSYRMRVKATNSGGETLGTDVTIKTPAGPKPAFKAKVGDRTTKITKLTVGGVLGGETVKLKCKTAAKGCPFGSKTIANLVKGTLTLTPQLKTSPLKPGAKVILLVSASGVRLSSLTLTIRDGEQPKVKRN